MKSPIKTAPSTYLWVAAYFLVLFVFHLVFSRTYFPVEYLGSRAAIWSIGFIPLLALAVHLTLMRSMPLWVFALVLGLDALVDVAVATHWAYFGAAPSILNLVTALHETSIGALHSGNFVPRWLLLVLACKLSLLLLLAWRLKLCLTWKQIIWGNLAATSLLGFAFGIRPPTDAARPYAYEVCIKVHGLYIAALSELTFRNSFLASINDAAAPPPPQLPEGSLKVSDDYLRSILAIQVESLDWEVLGYTYQGTPATPFLNSIRSRSLLLKLDPRHSSMSGSSGADFQVLAMAPTPHHRLALRETELESIPSLPRALARLGIRTVAMHGNSGAFWSRDNAYPKLGVSRFIEKKDYPVVDGGWGASDQTFFDFNAKLINATPEPTFFFMITLSSHAPFRWVRDSAFKFDGVAFDYLNSIHYTDRCIQRFIGQLKGKHLVFLYGDHASNVQNFSYNSKPKGNEYVPGMVFLLDHGEVCKPETLNLPNDLESGRYQLGTMGLLIAGVARNEAGAHKQ